MELFINNMDQGKRTISPKTLSLILIFLFQLTWSVGYADEWYQGGNLQNANIRRWLKASDANRLATSADWFMTMTKASNKALLNELKSMDKENYQAAVKYYATHLENCIAEKFQAKTLRYEDKVSDYAEKCYQILHGEENPLP
jgi:hypothetical protein